MMIGRRVFWDRDLNLWKEKKMYRGWDIFVCLEPAMAANPSHFWQDRKPKYFCYRVRIPFAFFSQQRALQIHHTLAFDTRLRSEMRIPLRLSDYWDHNGSCVIPIWSIERPWVNKRANLFFPLYLDCGNKKLNSGRDMSVSDGANNNLGLRNRVCVAW